MSNISAKKIALIMALPIESQGLFESENITVHYCGIGKVNAAFTAMNVIQQTNCQLILNLGTAGSAKFKTHDLIECHSFVQRDMDISPLGFAKGETPMDPIPGLIQVKSRFPELTQGICGTGDNFETGVSQVACDLVDMEAYAIAKVCKKMEVEFLSLKYITDGADDTAHKDWMENLKPGARKLLEYYKKIVQTAF